MSGRRSGRWRRRGAVAQLLAVGDGTRRIGRLRPPEAAARRGGRGRRRAEIPRPHDAAGVRQRRRLARRVVTEDVQDGEGLDAVLVVGRRLLMQLVQSAGRGGRQQGEGRRLR